MCATDCDVAPREFLGKFWTDSLVHDNTALELLVDVIGEDRIMLGTDYPFPLGEVKIVDTFPGKVVQESRFSDTLKVKIFSFSKATLQSPNSLKSIIPPPTLELTSPPTSPPKAFHLFCIKRSIISFTFSEKTVLG